VTATVVLAPEPSSTASARRARPSATGKDRVVALDGLRAVALLIIMGYHFGVGWLGGGFFSLDIFYVLSGYLITGLLVGEYRRRGAIKLSAFWLRRARRLLPALLIVLVAVTLLVRFVSAPGLYPDFRLSALSALFYFSNWWQISAAGNYFVATGAVSPLVHTWSLAVEEQFYLVWPLVVLAVMHLSRTFTRGIKALLAVSALGAVASAAVMVLLYHRGANITRLYFGTDTHAQSILIGAVIACTMTMIQMRRGEEGMAPQAHHRGWRILLVGVGAAGFAGTLYLTVTYVGTDAFVYRGGLTLSALSAAGIIIAAVTVPRGPVAEVLSIRPLVFLGTISYGAYLWHYPVYIFLDAERTGLRGGWLLALRFVVTFAVAAVSYYAVERPIMFGTFWRSLRAVAPATAAMAVTVIVIVAGTVAPEVGAVDVGSHLPAAEQGALTSAGAFGPHPVRFLLLGDSIAYTLAEGLQVDSGARYGVALDNQSVLGCDLDDLHAFAGGQETSPVSACNHWPTLWRIQVDTTRPDVVGLLMGKWDITDHLDRGRIVHIGEPAWNAHLEAELEQVVAVLSSTGARVVLFTMPYLGVPPTPNGTVYPENGSTRVDEFNTLLRTVAERHPHEVTLIDLNRLLDPGGRYQSVVDGVTVRWADGIHISKPGGEWLQASVLPVVARLGLAHRGVPGW
jgi:peptidoglycan/LPS O-acetylase OafA/YrhL